jgi:hypothetical protein
MFNKLTLIDSSFFSNWFFLFHLSLLGWLENELYNLWGYLNLIIQVIGLITDQRWLSLFSYVLFYVNSFSIGLCSFFFIGLSQSNDPSYWFNKLSRFVFLDILLNDFFFNFTSNNSILFFVIFYLIFMGLL